MRRTHPVLLVVACVAALLVPSGTAHAAGSWSPRLDVASGAGLAAPAVALNDRGAAAVAWTCTKAGERALCARLRRANGRLTPVQVLARGRSAAAPRIAAVPVVDPRGRATVFWTTTAHEVRARRLDGATGRLLGGTSMVGDRARTTGRLHAAVSRAGVATVVWAEAGRDGRGFVGARSVRPSGRMGEEWRLHLDDVEGLAVMRSGVMILSRMAVRGSPAGLFVTPVADDGAYPYTSLLDLGGRDEFGTPGTAQIEGSPDGSATVAWLDPRARGTLSTMEYSAEGTPTTVLVTQVTGLSSARDLVLARTPSGRLLASYVSGGVLWAMRLPTADDPGTEPVSLGRPATTSRTAVAAGEALQLVGPARSGGRLVTQTWTSGDGLTAPRPLPVSPPAGQRYDLDVASSGTVSAVVVGARPGSRKARVGLSLLGR